jgi:VanZ family protein
MQQKSKTNKFLATVFWLLSAICMGVIFYFSSRTANESAQQSNVILQWIIAHFGDGFFTDFVVRKGAHFLEYTGLCILFSGAWLFTKGKRQAPLSIICASAYAVTDEIHQIFVDGRSCEFRDWAIDTSGAVFGALIFLLIFVIVKSIVNKRKNNIDNQIH